MRVLQCNIEKFLLHGFLYEFTGTVVNRFLTNQNARSISVILESIIIISYSLYLHACIVINLSAIISTYSLLATGTGTAA